MKEMILDYVSNTLITMQYNTHQINEPQIVEYAHFLHKIYFT